MIEYKVQDECDDCTLRCFISGIGLNVGSFKKGITLTHMDKIKDTPIHDETVSFVMCQAMI